MKRVLLFAICAAMLSHAEMSLQLDKDRIEAGNTFSLELIVPLQELPESRSTPRMDARNGFTLLSLDSADRTMRPSMDDMFGSFFGRAPRPYKARIYSFKLRAPKKTGRLEAGSITWDINGEERTISRNIPITVNRSFNDDALTVSLTPSKKSVYEGEQFSVTLGFHTYEHFEGSLQATDMSTGNDFIVHRGDLSKMEFKPVDGARREMQASAKFAWLSPTKSGNLQIPPFKFKYNKRGEPKIVEEKKSMGGMQMQFQSIKQESVEAETNSPTVNITVKPLPQEGKPTDFSGMVGDYKFNADFDRTNLKVGEALTLSIDIKGDGTPGTITDPKLPNFDDFRSVPPENNISKKIQGTKVVTSKNIKIFLYPKKKGEFEIAPITYSWFNPARKKYETASAGPWKITVEKGESSAETVFQTPSNTGAPAVQKQEIESLGSDIRFIHNVSGSGNNSAPHRNIAFWIAFLAAIPFYFACSAAIRMRRKRNSNAALLRKGKAHKKLMEKFANARVALEKGDGKAFFASLESGLIDYLSNLTNVEFNGMTRTRMKEELENRNIKKETVNSIDSWLDKCAFVRFAPVTASKEEQSQMLREVEELCASLGDLK